ncbi:hypothetical protein NY547_11460 [Cnuibacter physcomitrellae]|uniref:hypothetical protein n=1 Tax=Cnuibacter physcomitrellae TaxID=1619308 RepID=UPI0021758487|nr:hypothetical protein [Cnuibacter physcomitrellae]MCS5497854.1 hypothetical protein [Cnuibacter physcomitrellae]
MTESAPPESPAATTARAERARASTRATGVVIVGMSIALWWPAFTVGAWGTLFFDQLLTVWAASVGALVVVLIQPRGRKRVGKALALLVPSLWILLSFLFVDSDSDDPVTVVVSLVAVLVAILGLPVTIWVLARVVWPEFGEDIPWSRRLIVLGAVLLIAVASFFLGANQSRFLTCGDFTISGNSEPPGCTPGPPDILFE